MSGQIPDSPSTSDSGSDDEGQRSESVPTAPPADAAPPAPADAAPLDPQEQRSLQYVQNREDYKGELLSDDSSGSDEDPQSPAQPPADAAPPAPADAAPPAPAEEQPKGKDPAKPKVLSAQRKKWQEQGILDEKRASQAQSQQRSRDRKKLKKEELERLAAEQKEKDKADREAEDRRQNPEKWALKEAKEAFLAIREEFKVQSLPWRTANHKRYEDASDALDRAEKDMADREEADRMNEELFGEEGEDEQDEQDEDPEVPELEPEDDSLLNELGDAFEEADAEEEVKEESVEEVAEEPQVQEDVEEKQEDEEDIPALAVAGQSRVAEEEEDPCVVSEVEIFRLMLALTSKMRKVQFLTYPINLAQFEGRKEVILNGMDPQGKRFKKEKVVEREKKRGKKVRKKTKWERVERWEEYDLMFGDGNDGKNAMIKREFPHETIRNKYVYKQIMFLIDKLRTGEENTRAEMRDLLSTGKAGSVEPGSNLDKAIKAVEEWINTHDAKFVDFMEKWQKVYDAYESGREDWEEKIAEQSKDLEGADPSASIQVMQDRLKDLKTQFREWKQKQQKVLKQWEDEWERWKADQDSLRKKRNELSNPDNDGFIKSAVYEAFEKVAKMIDNVLHIRSWSTSPVSPIDSARSLLSDLHKELMEALIKVCAVLFKKRKNERLTEKDCDDVNSVDRLLKRLEDGSEIESAWKQYTDFKLFLSKLEKTAHEAFKSAQEQMHSANYEDPKEYIKVRYPGAWLFEKKDATDDESLWDIYICRLLESKRLQKIPLTWTETCDVELGPNNEAARIDGFKVSRNKEDNIVWCMRPGANLPWDEVHKLPLVIGTDAMVKFTRTGRLLTLVTQDKGLGRMVDWFQPTYVPSEIKVPNAFFEGEPIKKVAGMPQSQYVVIDYGTFDKPLKGEQTGRTEEMARVGREGGKARQYVVPFDGSKFFEYTDAFGRATQLTKDMNKKRKADESGPSGSSKKRVENCKVKTGHLTMVSMRLNSNHKLWWISGRLKNTQMFDVPTLMAKKLGKQQRDGRAMMRGDGDAHGSDALTPLLTTGNMNLVFAEGPKMMKYSQYAQSDASFEYKLMDIAQPASKKACDLRHLDASKVPDFRGTGLLCVRANVTTLSTVRESGIADIRQEAVRRRPDANPSPQDLDKHTQYSRLFRSVFWKPRPFESFETFPRAELTDGFLRCDADDMPYAMAFSQVSACSENGKPTDTQEYYPEVCMFKEATGGKVANDNVEKNGAENFIRLVRPTEHRKHGDTPPSYAITTPPNGTKQWIAYKNAALVDNQDNEYKDHSERVEALEKILNYFRQHEVEKRILENNPKITAPMKQTALKLKANREQRWDVAGQYIYNHCLHLAPQNLEQAMMRYLVTFVPVETFPAIRGDGSGPAWLKNRLFKPGGLYVEFYGDTGKNEGEGGVDTYEPMERHTTLAQMCDRGGLNLRDFGEIWAEVDDGHWNAKRVGPPHWFRKEEQRSTGINAEDLAKLDASLLPAGNGIAIASEAPVNYNWNTVEEDPARNIANFLNKGMPPSGQAPHHFENGKPKLFPPCRLNKLTRDAAQFRLFKATKPQVQPDCPLRGENGKELLPTSEAAKDERAGRDDWYGPIYFVALDYDDVKDAMVSTEADWAIFMSQNDRTTFIKYSAQWLLLNADQPNAYLAVNPRYQSELTVGDGSKTNDKPDEGLVKDIVAKIMNLKGVTEEQATEMIQVCTRPLECPRKWWWSLRKQHGQVPEAGQGVSATFSIHVDRWLQLYRNRRDTVQADTDLKKMNDALADTFTIMRRHTLLLNWIVANPRLFGNGINSGGDSDPLGDQGVFMMSVPVDPQGTDMTDQEAVELLKRHQENQKLKDKWYALAMHNDVLEVANSLLVQITRTMTKRREVALRFCYGQEEYEAHKRGGTGQGSEQDLYPFVTQVVDTDGKIDDLPSVPNIEALVDILFSQMKLYLADESNVGTDAGVFERLCDHFHRLLAHTTPNDVAHGYFEEPGMQQRIQGLCKHIKDALSIILVTVGDPDIQKAWEVYRGPHSDQPMSDDIVLWNSEDHSKSLILQAASFVCHMEYSGTHSEALSKERRLSWVSTAMYLFTKTLLKAWWNNTVPVPDDGNELTEEAVGLCIKCQLQFLDKPRIGLDGVVNVTDYDAMIHEFGQSNPGQKYSPHKAQWDYVAFLSRFVDNALVPAEARLVSERQSITSALAVTIFSNFFSMFDEKLTRPIREAWNLWRDSKSHLIQDPLYPFHPTRIEDVETIMERLREALVAHVNDTAVGTTKEIVDIQKRIKTLEEEMGSDTTKRIGNAQEIQNQRQDLEAKKQKLKQEKDDQRQNLQGLLAVDFDQNYRNLASLLEKIGILSGEMQAVLTGQKRRNRSGAMAMDERTAAELEKQELKRLRTEVEMRGQVRANLAEEYRRGDLKISTLTPAQKRRWEMVDQSFRESANKAVSLTTGKEDDDEDSEAGPSEGTRAFMGQELALPLSCPPSPPSPESGPVPIGYKTDLDTRIRQLNTCLNESKSTTNEWEAIERAQKCELIDIDRAVTERLQELTEKTSDLSEELMRIRSADKYVKELTDHVYQVYQVMRDAQTPMHTIDSLQKIADGITKEEVNGHLEDDDENDLRNAFGTNSDSGAYEHDLSVWDDGREVFGIKGAYMDYFMSHFDFAIPTSGDIYVRVLGVPLSPQQWSDRLSSHKVLRRPPQEFRRGHTREMQASIEKLRIISPSDVHQHAAIVRDAAYSRFGGEPNVEKFYGGIDDAVATSSLSILGQFRVFYEKLLEYKQDTST